MGKIGIVGFHNLHLMQFLYKYTEILDKEGIAYDVLYWNRDGVEYPKQFGGNAICFDFPTSNYVSKKKKIQGYWKCRKFFLKTIKRQKYEKLILLTTQTAIAVSSIALRKYTNRYIYDYRDITMESNILYKKIVMKLVKNSVFTAISSKGFISNIGESEKYILAHNCRSIKSYEHTISRRKPVRIVFWGIVRQIDYQKRICDFFGNDDRFQLYYHGEGDTEQLKKYCQDKSYINIFFTGRYFEKEIKSFARETDILLNTYENDGKQEFALTVKLYDAIRYRIPMLVTDKSYMQQYIGNNNIAYPFQFASNDKEKIIEWYFNLNDLNYEYSILETDIKNDEKKFRDELIKFVNK